jgi:TP53 regulating kinase-like protein
MAHTIMKKEIIKKGAEAVLFTGQWFGHDVIFKHRIPKEYRIDELDRQIRFQRTINETRAMIKAKELGINVPQVYEIDYLNSIIVMSYIKGEKLKDIMNQLSNNQKKWIFRKLGKFISKLHQNGQIHGDITTSNIILTKEEKLFLIDFGLHEYSDSIEDKSVDLHLFKRVLISSHGGDYKLCFRMFLDGYKNAYPKGNRSLSESIIKNIEIIETRGRYIKKQNRL